MQVLKNKKKYWETLGDGAANYLLDQGATGVASPNIYIYISSDFAPSCNGLLSKHNGMKFFASARSS
jgi:hypothetical protein